MPSFKDIVSSSLPFLGSLIGGPMGASVGNILSKLITGKDNASEDEIQSSLLAMAPDKLIELKKIDLQYKESLLKNSFDTQKLSFDDLANARHLQEVAYNRTLDPEVKILDLLSSRVPAILPFMVFPSFVFVVLILLFIHDISQDKKDILEIVLGALAAFCGQCFNYWLGDTHTSHSTKSLDKSSK
jgi:hypothetical protein